MKVSAPGVKLIHKMQQNPKKNTPKFTNKKKHLLADHLSRYKKKPTTSEPQRPLVEVLFLERRDVAKLPI